MNNKCYVLVTINHYHNNGECIDTEVFKSFELAQWSMQKDYNERLFEYGIEDDKRFSREIHDDHAEIICCSGHFKGDKFAWVIKECKI